MRQMKFSRCAELLLEHNDILILTHKNPDGDTVGSAASLCSALRRAGKRAWLYPNPQIGDRLRAYVEEFFPPEEDMRYAYTVAVDVATEKLFPQGFDGAVDLCIDHHQINTHYARRELIRADRSSCGELMLKIIRGLGSQPSAQEATLMYIAVSTDTGCFQYLNTDQMTFATAAELLGLGADMGRVNNDFFRKVSPARLKLEGEIYSGLGFYLDGRVTVATVTLDMLRRTGAKEDDCDDLAGLAGRVAGSQVSVTIRELSEGECRVSVRSGPEVSSADICAVFGGGGHAMAAGCTISATPDYAKEMLISVIGEILP